LIASINPPFLESLPRNIGERQNENRRARRRGPHAPHVHRRQERRRQDRQLASELLTGELRTLIAVEDLRPAPAQGALQRLDAEFDSRVSDNLQLRTYRLNQSITATR